MKSSFVYFACQHGAEPILKSQLCEPAGPYRLSFSKPGFVTLKSDLVTPAWSRALPDLPLVRSRGHVLERLEGEDTNLLLTQFLENYLDKDWKSVHVWQRDVAQPGWHGFEPGRSPLAESVAELLKQKLNDRGDPRAHSVNEIAPIGTHLIEIILVEPNQWWIAAKPVQTNYDSWPGGVYAVKAPESMISRAYLKIAEAIPWSQLPMRVGNRVVEIGSAPGGACQRLLDLGMDVTGIDPADMDPRVADHSRFTHWRSRSLQVKRRLFKPFQYLICDANVAPNYTLDTVEAIVTFPTSHFRGLILTIKLSTWDHALRIPEHLERVQSWGFDRVDARQLGHNRREYCLIAEKTDSTSASNGSS